MGKNTNEQSKGNTREETKEELRRKASANRIIAKRLEESLIRICDDIAEKEMLLTGIDPNKVKIKLYCRIKDVLLNYHKYLDNKES